MSNRSFMTVDRKLLQSFAAPFAWMALTTGVFNLVTRATLAGFVWLAVAIAVAILSVTQGLTDRLVGRHMSTAGMGLIVLILILVGIDEVVNLLSASPTPTASFVVDTIGGVGYLVLATLVVVKMAKLIRSRA